MLRAPYTPFRIPQWCYEAPERSEDDDYEIEAKQTVYTFKGKPERGAVYLHDFKESFYYRGYQVLESLMGYYIVYIQEEDRTFFGFPTKNAIRDFIKGYFTGTLFYEKYAFHNLA